MSRKGSRYRSDINLPEKHGLYHTDSPIIRGLLDFDAILDKAIYEKRLHMRDIASSPLLDDRKVQLYVWNEMDEAISASNDTVKHWTLRFAAKTESGEPVILTDVLEKIIVELDPSVYPGLDSVIEWVKPENYCSSSGFEISRRFHSSCTARVSLHTAYTPVKYTPSAALAGILGTKDLLETKPQYIARIWKILVDRKAQDVLDPERILLHMCPSDPADLIQVFGKSDFSVYDIPALLEPHLNKIKPLQFLYHISESSPVACYDIRIPRANAHTWHHLDPQIKELHQRMHDSVMELEHHGRKRDFLVCMSEDPLSLIRLIICNQTHSQQPQNASKAKTDTWLAEDFDGNWLYDVVDQYLSKKEEERIDREQQEVLQEEPYQ